MADRVTEQAGFILDKQLAGGDKDGAIVGPNGRVVPYFANQAAIALVRCGAPTAVLKWLDWYLRNLNQGDANIPALSVYDWTWDGETLTSTGDFDSVDSYASTLLELVAAAYTTRDMALRTHVRDNIDTYKGVADLLVQDVRSDGGPTKGLTFAKPSHRAFYVMDNAEVYAGLRDFASLLTSLGDRNAAAYYRAYADETRQAITSSLWGDGVWDWAHGNPAHPTRSFYPDAAAQVWPVLYGVVAPDDEKAVAAWKAFTSAYPKWYAGVPDSFPWASIARASRLMGNTADAVRHLQNITERFAGNGWTHPTSCGASPCGTWHIGEAAWFIDAATGIDW
jgi:hypothetical protein